ncbi:MAG: hypothetical protein J5525_12895 [Lachnospiraceae bacterium]|nr:hypothetical protein [Lachnospiraceae bacterium]
MVSNYQNLDRDQLEFANKVLMRQQKIIVPEGTEEVGTNKALAVAISVNLASYGYIVDTETMDKLSTLNKNQLAVLWEDFVDNVNSYTGIENFKKNDLFYPNFPEQVMRLSEVDLYLNSLTYYSGYYYFGMDLHDELVPEEKKVRLPFVEEYPTEKKLLVASSADELATMMFNSVHSMGISKQQELEIREYAKLFPEDMKSIVMDPTPFTSKENYVKVGDICASNNLINIREWFKDAPDVMRYAAYLSNKKGTNNNIDLSGNLRFHLSNSEKKLVREMLSNCPHLFEDIWTRPKEETWKYFARHIDCKNPNPARTNVAFQKLYHGDKTDEQGHPIKSVERQFEEAWENLKKKSTLTPELYSDALSRMASLASSFPGLYMRHHLSYVDDAIQNENKLIADTKLFAKEAILTNKIPPVALLELEHVIDERYSSELRVFTKPNGDTQAKENAYKDLVPKEVQETLKENIRTSLTACLKDTKELGKVYIDPQLDDFKAPKRDIRNASGGAVLTKYSAINGKEGKNLMAIGANWTGRDVDIDVSADVYNKDYENIGNLYYGSLKEAWGVHSGDYVTAPNGASEICILDKNILKEMGATYVGFNVRGFSAPFDQAKDGVQVIFMEKEGSLEYARSSDIHGRGFDEQGDGHITFLGETIEPTQIEYPIKLNAHATNETTFLYNVEKDQYVWVDKAGGNALGTNIMCDDQKTRTLTEIYAIEHCTIPSMKEVIDAYIEAGNGVITDDIKEADTIFIPKTIDSIECELKEGAKIYSALDANMFSSEFCACQEKLGEAREQDIGARTKVVEEEKEPDKRTPLEKRIAEAIAISKENRTNKRLYNIDRDEKER